MCNVSLSGTTPFNTEITKISVSLTFPCKMLFTDRKQIHLNVKVCLLISGVCVFMEHINHGYLGVQGNVI